jgi:aerobic-type carbon monoxide dehydrogenase small subunit (CoxS/CutS family)
MVDGRRINSCLTLAVMHEGDEITTIEGLGTPDKLHPMQAAFVKHDGYQCGYCTPGQICSAVAVLDEIKAGIPSHVSADLTAAAAVGDELRERMSGNICRCGAYSNIVEAITEVAGAGKGMKAFTYERAARPPRRPPPRAHARRQVHRRRHQPARPDEAADRDAAHLIDVNGLGWTRSSRRRTAACASARWCATPTWPPTRACGATTACCRAPAGRRLGPAAQQGDHRRQPAAAHALPVFLRHQPALQQAPARQRLLGHRRLQPPARGRRRQRACIATHPSDMAVAMRVLDATVETVKADGAARVIPIADFHRLPGDTPHIETALRRRTDHRRDPAEAGGRHAHLPQGARPRVLRLRAGLGGAIVQRDGTAAWRWAAWRTSPGA